ncbi:6281_t:CDS:2 [Diversispora eburnea]|uniref:6281_t:CDS:1 n=1 Tax=Diversispora eburnea TaxID=1213867 RepID=A0A9N8UYV5_9GLOM|nr:6281_t:CDS:2 [Diversispora eburnea]
MDKSTTATEEKKEFPQIIYLTEYRIIILSILIPFSIIGVLIRIGLNKLHQYPGAPVDYLVYPQFVGCVIMGFCLERKDFIMESYLPLYIGLKTGLCAKIGIIIGMSIIGLKFGEHFADLIMPNQKAPAGLKQQIILKSPKFKDLLFLDWICLFFGISSMILVIFLATFIKVNRNILFATVFAPWYLSRLDNNFGSSTFPIGTFSANMLGTLILGLLFFLSNGIIHSNLKCEIVTGLMDGLCGCLTTISTFTISTLNRRHAYIYATISIVVGQVIMIFTVGIYHWSVGLTKTCSS